MFQFRHHHCQYCYLWCHLQFRHHHCQYCYTRCFFILTGTGVIFSFSTTFVITATLVAFFILTGATFWVVKAALTSPELIEPAPTPTKLDPSHCSITSSATNGIEVPWINTSSDVGLAVIKIQSIKNVCKKNKFNIS